MVSKRTLKMSICAAAALLTAASFQPSAQEAQDGVRLSLDQCLRMALENNLDLVSARIDPEIAEQSVAAETAAFDGAVNASARRFEATQEATDISQAPGFRQNSFSVGYEQQLGFGAAYSVTLSAEENNIDVPPGSVFFRTPTEFNTDLQFGLRLPLLKGFGTETTQERLLLARGNLDVSREEFRRQVEVTMETVEAAYWDVLAAQEGLRIARLALKRAQDLLELNRKKVEVGTLAPIEITQAEAGVAAEVERVIVAEVALANAQDELRRLLAVPEGDAMWGQPLEPADRPSFQPLTVNLEDSIRTALAERPEMITARREQQNRELSARVAKRQLRHQLDLELSYTPQGTDIDEFIPVSVDPGPDMIPGTNDDTIAVVKVGDGNLVDSLNEIPDIVNRNWSAGLNYSFPIGNRAAKSRYQTASLNLEKSTVLLQNQEQTVRVEVRRAVREVESGIKRVEAARANVVLQRKKLEAEQKKFENGMSTSFEVLTFQRDLADSELGEIRARLDYMKALTALERVKGTLLQARGLSLAL